MRKLLILCILMLGPTCLATGCSTTKYVVDPRRPLFLAQDADLRVATFDNQGKIIVLPQRVHCSPGMGIFWPDEVPNAEQLGLDAGPFDWLQGVFGTQEK